MSELLISNKQIKINVKFLKVLIVATVFSNTAIISQTDYKTELNDGITLYNRGQYYDAYLRFNGAKAFAEVSKNKIQLEKAQNWIDKAVTGIQNDNKRAVFEKRNAQSLSLVANARERLLSDPTKALRFAELAWKLSPSDHVPLQIKKVLANAWYQRKHYCFYSKSFPHDYPVWDAILSPDGSIIAGRNNKKIVLWDVKTALPIHHLQVEDNVNIIFSNDGTKLFTIINNVATVWDVNSSKKITNYNQYYKSADPAILSSGIKRCYRQLDNNDAEIIDANTLKRAALLKEVNNIRSITFSSDATRLLTVSRKEEAVIWDVQNEQKVSSFQIENTDINTAVFSQDNKKVLLTAFGNKNAAIWDTNNGKLITELKGHRLTVNAAVFSPDGQIVVTNSRDRTTRIWDANTGEEKMTIMDLNNNLKNISFSPDGKSILTNDKEKVRIFDAETGEEKAVLAGHKNSVNSAYYSVNGENVITASHDHFVKLWNIDSSNELKSLIGHKGPVIASVFSTDNKKIITNSLDLTAKIWNSSNGELISTLSGHKDTLHTAILSPDSRKAYTVSLDKTVKTWDAETGGLLDSFSHEKDDIHYVFISNNGTFVITMSKDSKWEAWDTKTKTRLNKVNKALENTGIPFISPDDKRLFIVKMDGRAKLIEMNTGKELTPFNGSYEDIKRAAFSPDGKQIATIFEKEIKVLDTKTGKEFAKIKISFGEIISAVFSNDSQKIFYFTSGREDGIWDYNSGRVIRIYGHNDIVLFASFSPDGSALATASIDNTAKLWDTKLGKEIVSFTDHNAKVFQALISFDGNKLLTASLDGSVKLRLTPKGIMDSLKTANIDKLSHLDFQESGNDFLTIINDDDIKNYPENLAKAFWEMDLSNQGIKEIPSEIEKFSNIQFLNLRNNFLKSLPKEISKLKKLRRLILIDNRFSDVEKAKVEKYLPNCDIYWEARNLSEE